MAGEPDRRWGALALYALLAVGCTGGKHRSVAMAEELAARLTAAGVDVTVNHRDLGRE